MPKTAHKVVVIGHRNPDYTAFLIHLVNDRSGTSNRLIPEIYRSDCLQTAQSVMINDLLHLCLFNSIHSL